MTRPQKITFGEMRSSGVRGLLIYCYDYTCSHWIILSADQWGDDVRPMVSEALLLAVLYRSSRWGLPPALTGNRQYCQLCSGCRCLVGFGFMAYRRKNKSAFAVS
jgi:hypothetical protein